MPTPTNMPPAPVGDTLEKSEKVLSALGYVSFFCILPLVLRPQSEFCKYHGKQGLVLTIMFLVAGILGIIHGFFEFIVGLAWLVAIVYSIMQVWKGKKHKLPMVSEMAASEYLDF